MDEPVLYETRHHASRPFTLNYPPQQADKGGRGGFLSLLSVQGVNQLKEKWIEYKQPRKLRKLTSLFISPSGEHVAVASGNLITILQKKDDYLKPCGTFTSKLFLAEFIELCVSIIAASSLVIFTVGTWSESHDVLGVVDDTDTLYFIKANGEEISRITKRHLKVSSPIVSLIANRDSDVQRSCLCSFNVVTYDGSLQHIEISREPNASVENGLTLKGKFGHNVFCLDSHPELLLFVVVTSSDSIALTSSGNTGSSYLSLWRRSNVMDLEQLFSIQFEGLYSKPKGYRGLLAYPKVQISPDAEFVCTLDTIGCLHIFKLDKQPFSLSKFMVGERCGSQVTSNSLNGREIIADVVDFSWWSDHVLAIAKKTGVITMIDIRSGLKVQENDPVYSMPVLERAFQFQGNLFVLESMSTEERDNLSNDRGTGESHCIEQITEDRFNSFDISKLSWNLITFSRRSIGEMYDILVSNKRYQAALDFADCHGLDKDEVIKSQWLHSSRGLNEITMYLSKIKDKVFILSECVDKVGPTEESVKALLEYGLHLTNQYTFSERQAAESAQIWDFRVARLKLLQFRDRLETYLGINMGRFSVQEYAKFRVMPINEAAVVLAESGKIGALNLLFKRHPYSLAPFILEILAAIPETLPVQTYGQLLPGSSPPSNTVVREEDWVECKKMVTFVNSLQKNDDTVIQIRTEPVVKQCSGFVWPSRNELLAWYKKRARDIDMFSGQLDNCLCLLDYAIRKGISELKRFHEDVSYLQQLIYSEDSDGEMSLNLVTWEQLSDYDKFKVMLKGVNEENVVEKLHDKAIPFMRNRFHYTTSLSQDHVTGDLLAADHDEAESFLVRWLKETASENKLDICLRIIEDGCGDTRSSGLFKDEVEAINCALQCLYLSKVTDKWSTMAAILSKLPHTLGRIICDGSLERRLKLAEGHIEVGRLLSYYQVPKPMCFFLEPHADGKGVKQILRLILSKFIRRQPGRSDTDWANMWRDMQCMKEKAFPFLDPEYMLMEFCRGLLKAGKFSLARNYLRGTSSVALASDKAENLVIQAAREYFFSASSLACPEIWKAKECLSLLSSSGIVKAELDTIDAITVKLPSLGLTLLPMQFRQIKDQMEIVKMAITSQAGAYLHVDEIIEIAKLLGLSSPDDISAVQEAIAREAAVAGDLQLALDLCLVLAKKGHGQAWDLCAAIARGPALENMDVNSRKQLLGFALSHCDEESISELLYAWKDLDMQGQCEMLMTLTESNYPNFSIQGSSTESDSDNIFHLKGSDDQEVHFSKIKNILSTVAKSFPVEKGSSWESVLGGNGKILSFAALQLPWLLELSKKAEINEKSIYGLIPRTQYLSVRTQAVVTILSWLARNDFAPKDDLIASLAKSTIEPPITEEKDIICCSFLLNLVDAFCGVEVIEEQLRKRKDYQQISSIMNVGMIYSLLHNYGVECQGPAQRRAMLLKKFKEKQSPGTDEINKIDEVQSSFWREWKRKLEEQKFVADRSRALEKIIPWVDTAQFLSGDIKYIESVFQSLFESVKLEKKHTLKDILKLADTYGLNRTKVLLQYLSSLLVSEVWTNDDITYEISGCRTEIIGYAIEVIHTISSIVYPAIDGCDKSRLALVFSLLSDCYLQLEETKKSLPMMHPDQANLSSFGFAHYYKLLEQECSRVSFLTNINFKNIAGLGGLNFECFNREINEHIDDSSLEVLAKMIENLSGIYTDSVPDGLISWRDVYKHYVLSLLKTLETKARADFVVKRPENLQGFVCQLEQSFEFCRKFIKLLAHSDALDIIRQYFTVIMPLCRSYGTPPDDSTWQDCLLILSNFWMRLTDEMKEITSHSNAEETLLFSPDCLIRCLNVFMRLVIEDNVSPSQGWTTLISYVNHGLAGGPAFEVFMFCRAMLFSGCGFRAVAELFSEAVDAQIGVAELRDLSHLYLNLLEPILQDLAVGESQERQNFYHILSSVSKLDGDLKDLNQVRHVIWKRLVKFSDDLQIPGSIRVYVLELMQFLSGSIKGFSAEIQSNVIPWEGWDEAHYTNEQSETSANQGSTDHNDTSGRFTSTLVALKSSQLVASILPTLEITSDDLSTVETAVSCFFKLSGVSQTDAHIDSLLDVLGEWEGLFLKRHDEEASLEESDAGNTWNTDNWDEGWESFQDIEPPEKEKSKSTPSLHPLHVCWSDIFQKLVSMSRFRDVLRLIDQSNDALLDEDGAKILSDVVLQTDCFMALKLVLLLPYEALHLHCLAAVEEKLKQGGFSDTVSQGIELLLLISSSGVMSNIISKSSYGTTFSYVCYLVGSFSHKCQAAQLSSLVHEGSEECEDNEREFLIFKRIVFPYFVSELVKADQQLLAGLIVTKFMHTNASLSLVNITDSSLTRFLERQLHLLQHDKLALSEATSHETLKNSVSSLMGKLEKLVQSALSLVSSNERWGGDRAALIFRQSPSSWKKKYEVQDRCDRIGVGMKIIREGGDYYLVHHGEIQRYLGSRRQSLSLKRELSVDGSLKVEESCRGILDKILFFIGDLEVASTDAKRGRVV
ncbi:Sec39 domain containing protein [Parasponia andersonii]|uniref:Sec39 domain containing protein n=1 Tax=Parasponia andersonii TaxID=3476 RepID=A0A2P5DFG9_PARAD|nr:Sec39 domain containing protein [Parasponia andersonii]